MHGKGGQEIIREDDYKGHHVIVRTRYDITIDGQVVTGHIMLTNLGQVQYHGLPNHSFHSPVELARPLIDNFPQGFAIKRGPRSPRGQRKAPMGKKKMPATKTTKSSKSNRSTSKPRSKKPS